MKKMTEKAMGEALAGESMARTKYTAFSEIAEKEGLPNIARLFKATAYAEEVHAKNHARTLGSIGDTKENLKAAIDGEDFEVDEMYPAYDAVAKLQDEKEAQRSIHFAIEAEKIHSAYYAEALATLETGKDADIAEIYICPVCGYTHQGTPPDKCPVCSVPKDKFKQF